jgi:soluble P-type ATPase
MLEIPIPGQETLRLEHIVLDYNGTLAVDGEPMPGIVEGLRSLSRHLSVHVVTADTFGKVADRLKEANFIRVSILPAGNQTQAKLNYIKELGADQCVTVGNGRNDQLMIKAAALGIVVILAEGCSAETLRAADVVCTDITSALDLLIHPLRLTATLRS